MSRSGILASLIFLSVAVVQPAIAHAEFGITPGSEEFSVLNAGGQPESQVGAHPDRLVVKFNLNTIEGGAGADGNLKDITMELPPGLTGNPSGVPTCSRTAFDGGLAEEKCPPEAQVGEVRLEIPGFRTLVMAIFNLEPAPHEMAALGAALEKIRKPILMQLRPGDHGTTLVLADLFQSLPISAAEVELWGVPVDHQSEVIAPRLPFLTLPSHCGEPLELSLSVNSWQAPDVEHTVHMDSGAGLNGCDSQPFGPSIAFAMESPTADVPSGAGIDIAEPQNNAPDGRASAQLRDAVIALPKGVTLSSAGVAGIEACTGAEFGSGTTEPAACPAASRVGSVEMTSSALRAPMTGGLYMGEGPPGERFRLFVVAGGPGVEVKLIGALKIDPVTGQLTVVLSNLPRVPLEHMKLSFLGGPRAPLVTPLGCGPLTTTAHFGSQGDAVREVSSATELGGGSPCPRAIPFKPGFSAGAQQVEAGKEATLGITVRRQDGEQVLDRLSALLPFGMSPALGAVELCGPSGAASGDCPAASRIGSAVAEVGSGTEPTTLQGSIFLTGPYRGAPFGLVFTFRALLGNFDLGTLAARGALRIDPRSGQATLETSSLPQMIEGVPIRFRTVGLDIDRPGFIHNPTSCAAESFEATIFSAEGSKSDAASPFEVRGCESLKFHPDISMALRGATQLHKHGKPGLRLGLRSPQGSTNLRDVEIPLPRVIKFDPSGPAELCARQEAIAGDCPPGSLVGTAAAKTTLLSGQMKGSIYAVQPAGNGLPDLWTELDEKGLHLIVQAKTTVEKGHLTTKLVEMPDVTVSALKMKFNGGSGGIFTLRQDLCRPHASKKLMSTVALEGQNRAFRLARVELTHPSCARTDPQGMHGG